jgi:hypothetical protein
MSIRPVDISGMIQRTDDVGMVKHHQDSRQMTLQQHAQGQMVKKTDDLMHQVIHPENRAKTDTHADAREKGKNSYFVRKKSQNKKTEEEPKDYIFTKQSGGAFDVKI